MTVSERSGRMLRPAVGALALLAAGGLAAARTAQAATPAVDITVTPIPSVVSYSRPQANPPLVTYAAYQVKVVNRGTAVVDGVQFDAQTTAVAAVGSATFKESAGATCNAVQGPTAVSCPVGTLRAQGGTASFVVVFRAPTAAVDPLTPGRVELDWTLSYGAAAGAGARLAAARVTTQQAGAAVTRLGTPTNTQVKAYVPSAGGTLFTGPAALPTSSDRWTTTVRVPASAQAEVIETVVPSSCSPLYNVCVASTLRIPGSFSNLGIVLRRDAGTLTPGAKIANAVLSYQQEVFDKATQTWKLVGPVQDIVSCDLLPNRKPNATTRRCLDYRRAYTTQNAPTPSLAGDWEFGLKALENGRISW